MKFSKAALFSILIAIPCTSRASADVQQAPRIEAIRTQQAISVDGSLDETAWEREGYSRLIQRDPIEGAEPTERTSVLIAYNDEGLYVAGTCYHTGPDTIVGGLARRDRTVESDWLWFWIDPNYDHQNGFGFAVNPDGSIIDQRLYRDIMTDDDWDGVWEAAAVRQSDRWTFEIFIPFDQLRFDKQDEYVWGVNFKRYILANAEDDYFVMVPKDESGFVSRFGQLTGLQGIEPPPRLFISPYTMGQINDYPGTSDNPFYSDMRYGRNLGLDIKYGLTGNLTLDLAINPDFGQAEVDPAVINLSAFETFYSEKRTFFLEGSDIFRFGANPTGGVWNCDWYGPRMFYSRRIGRRPAGDPVHDGEFYAPEQTTILGAAKISGKIRNWSIGSVNAVTQQEVAQVEDTLGGRFEDIIEPRSFYGVYRGVGEFNDSKQGLGFLFTYVQRDQDPSRLRADNNDRAIVSGADGWAFLGQERKWAFMGQMAWSHVEGSKERMVKVQRSSRHRFQRPDLEAATLDSNRTALDGWMGRFGLRTVGGNAHFQTALGLISPGFNVNDLGYNSRGNVINWHVAGSYSWLEPTSWYRQIVLVFMTSRNFDFEGNQLAAQVWHEGAFQRLDYIRFSWHMHISHDGRDLFTTRGGPSIATPGYTGLNVGVSNDSRKAVTFGAWLTGQWRQDGSFYHNMHIFGDFRLAASLKLSLFTDYYADDYRQWVDKVDDPEAEYGQHYIFGTLDQEEVSATLRLDWGVTPRLSLQAYVQPFFSVGAYSGFKEAIAQSKEFNPYDYESHPDYSDPDFNYKSFRANVVLRWEYLPGSLLYLVWTQNRVNTEWPGEFDLGRDARALVDKAGDNIFFIKVSHMFSVL